MAVGSGASAACSGPFSVAGTAMVVRVFEAEAWTSGGRKRLSVVVPEGAALAGLVIFEPWGETFEARRMVGSVRG